MRKSTPARLGLGRAGPRYTTAAMLSLRADHARAVDAVMTEVARDWPRRNGLLEVHSQAQTREDYIRYPELGRRLTDADAKRVARLKPPLIRSPFPRGKGLGVRFRGRAKCRRPAMHRRRPLIGRRREKRSALAASTDEAAHIALPAPEANLHPKRSRQNRGPSRRNTAPRRHMHDRRRASRPRHRRKPERLRDLSTVTQIDRTRPHRNFKHSSRRHSNRGSRPQNRGTDRRRDSNSRRPAPHWQEKLHPRHESCAAGACSSEKLRLKDNVRS